LLTAVLGDRARVVRRQGPDTSGYHEHKPFAITVPSSHVVSTNAAIRVLGSAILTRSCMR
jgi:hypothetical protein